MLLRFNSQLGMKFVEDHLRVIEVASEEAFIRVVLEVCWQLCALLERFKC